MDAGGVEALWCIPDGAASDAVLVHTHMGGSVLMSMHSDRKAAAHIAKAAGARSLVLNFRRSPEHKYPAQVEDVCNAYYWLLAQGYKHHKIASVGSERAAWFKDTEGNILCVHAQAQNN